MDKNTGDAPSVQGRSGRQTKFFVGGAIVILVIGYLIWSSLTDSTAQYLTTSEAKAQAASDRMVRVSGAVIGDSITWDAHTLTLRFELSDETGKIPVYYKGLRPDMLRDEATAIVEGKMGSDGVFQASQIILKCPSKYEEKATEQATTD